MNEKVRIGDSVRSKKRSRSILFTSKSVVVTFFRVTFFLNLARAQNTVI